MSSWQDFFITQVCYKKGLTEKGLSKRQGEILLAKFPDEETIRTNEEVADDLTDDKFCTTENVDVQMRTIYTQRFCAKNCQDAPDFQGKRGQERDPLFQAWLKRKYQEYLERQGLQASDSDAIAIEMGFDQDLSTEGFAQRLQEHYNLHFQRRGMYDKPLPEAKIKLVYILGEVRQPVSIQKLCDFSSEDASTVLLVLKEWKQFLHEEDKESQKRYSVSDSSLLDFLHHQDILDKLGVALPKINQLIAKAQLSNFYNHNLSPEDEEYVVHLPYHLAMAGMSDDLYNLLTKFEFINTKFSALGTQPLIEDYDLALQSEIITSQHRFKGNTDTLKLIQRALRWSAHILDEDKTQLIEQLWVRLSGSEKPEIKEVLKQAKQRKASPWLRPLIPIFTPRGGRLQRTLQSHCNEVNAVVVTPDGKLMISGSDDKTLKVWDLATGKVCFTLEGHSDVVDAIAVTPDSKLAISGSWDNTLIVWDLATGKECFTLEFERDLNSVNAVTVTPDGKRAIASAFDEPLKVWDLATGKVCFTLEGHSEEVNAIAVTPDGKQLISGSYDKTLKVWDLATGKVCFTLEGHSDSVTAVAVTPDGKQLISGSDDKTLKVWDLATGKVCFTLEGHNNSAYSIIVVTPDGKLAISDDSYDKTLKVWDLATGKVCFTLKGHSDRVTAVAVTTDGKLAISISYSTLIVWDLCSKEIITSFTCFTRESALCCCAVAPDGLTIIVGEYSGRVHFLRLEGV